MANALPQYRTVIFRCHPETEDLSVWKNGIKHLTIPLLFDDPDLTVRPRLTSGGRPGLWMSSTSTQTKPPIPFWCVERATAARPSVSRSANPAGPIAKALVYNWAET